MTDPNEASGQVVERGGRPDKKVFKKTEKCLPYGQPTGRVKEASELPAQRRSGDGFGLDAQKRYFIAKTEEFLEHLRLHELVGREEYEGQIQQALRELERSPASEESERIMNEICLKVTIVCYALRAYERIKKRKKPERGD